MKYETYEQANHIQSQLEKLLKLSNQILASGRLTLIGEGGAYAGEKKEFNFLSLDDDIRKKLGKDFVNSITECKKTLEEEFEKL